MTSICDVLVDAGEPDVDVVPFPVCTAGNGWLRLAAAPTSGETPDAVLTETLD
jgi:hypothetical protein